MASIEAPFSNACYFIIKSDNTYSIHIDIANEIRTEAICPIWCHDIAIGGGIEYLCTRSTISYDKFAHLIIPIRCLV